MYQMACDGIRSGKSEATVLAAVLAPASQLSEPRHEWRDPL